MNKDPIEIGRVANFAENSNGNASERLKKRLSQDRRPSTALSTEQWVNWGAASEYLGQPFDASRIPLSKLEQMQRDAMLSFGLTFIKVPLIRAPWYIKSSDAKRAAFIDNALRKIYGRLILAYSNSLSFGYSGIVKRFEYSDIDWTYVDKDDPTSTESPVWDDSVVKPLIWKPFLALNPRYVTPHWNYKGDFNGIDLNQTSGISAFQNSAYSGNFGGENNKKVADIPLDWALWATNEKDSVYGSLWGYPRLGYAYRYWWSYWYLFALSDRAFERWADPPIIVYHPADEGFDEEGNVVDLAAEGLVVAEKARSGANVSLPAKVIRGFDERATNIKEWSLEQMKSEINFAALDEMFKYLDVQKLRSMMVPEQSLMEGQGGSSSRNVAEQFGDIFQESQAVVMQEIDDMINRYMIPQLLEANFGPGGPSCTKVTTGFDPQDVDTMRSIVGSFANKDTEMPVDIRETLERLGVPTLSHAAFQENLKKKAEEAAKLRPLPVKDDGENAGVTDTGLYYEGREQITLNAEESSALRRAFNQLLGR
jgi:hypothetical protein